MLIAPNQPVSFRRFRVGYASDNGQHVAAMKSFYSRRNSAAFTLLEIAIAVTLLAMVMTLAAVQVRGYHARQQLEYAAHQVQLRLQGLRQKSIREEKTSAVRVDWEESRMVWSQLTTQDPDDPAAGSWTEFQTLYQVEEPVTFIKPRARTSNEDEAVYFYPDGRCRPTIYQLQHSRTKESLWIALTDWSGEATIQDQPSS
jgi:Tfp pilus assembly protein FimT